MKERLRYSEKIHSHLYHSLMTHNSFCHARFEYVFPFGIFKQKLFGNTRCNEIIIVEFQLCSTRPLHNLSIHTHTHTREKNYEKQTLRTYSNCVHIKCHECFNCEFQQIKLKYAHLQHTYLYARENRKREVEHHKQQNSVYVSVVPRLNHIEKPKFKYQILVMWTEQCLTFTGCHSMCMCVCMCALCKQKDFFSHKIHTVNPSFGVLMIQPESTWWGNISSLAYFLCC